MSPTEALSPGYRLKVLSADGGLVRSFPLPPGEHVVGSAPDAGIVLDLPGISRRHAVIRVLADGGVVLSDLDSKNGTFVAGRRIRETVVEGVSVVAFGGQQAVLQPEHPSRSQILLEPPRGEAERPRGGKAPSSGLSTSGLHPLERLVESLLEVLPPLAEGRLSSREAASQLVLHWIESLPVGRVEILRSSAAGEAVVAAASTFERVPRAAESLEVEGPGGWKILLRVPSSTRLPVLEPLFRLTLSLLAAREAAPQRRVAAGSPVGQPAGEAGAAEALPPGLGPEMSRIYKRAAKVGRGEVPVLVLGESGSGKEVLARWVHGQSRRVRGPFLAVNCAALPRELLESELFGIEKGVATGVEARPGLLERASGGTVFLDEVGDMAPETQAKVLRVLESTSLYRVGGRSPVTVDVRFVSATNRDLEAMVEEGGFRRDLFHRLAAFQVSLPPLRGRREEIPSLAARFFHRELGKNGLDSPGITRAALGILVRYPWPGNVRELQNEIAKAALLLEPGEALDLQHLSERVRRPPGVPPGERRLLTLEETVRRAEREAFAVALAAAGGDAAGAIELLGVSRTTWYRKLKELGLGDASEPAG